MDRIEELESALKVILTAMRDDEKMECWTIRKWLDERGIFNGDISRENRLVEAVCIFALKK